jgi:23S rRNA (cytosine1962-C5)-methyltransferase
MCYHGGMKILETSGWKDYELLDSGNGRRLERFGNYVLSRPDPQCIWSPLLDSEKWKTADATFMRGKNGKEQWVRKTEVPQKWLMTYKDLSFYAKLSPFKHTGVFPEQHLMWDWLAQQIADGIKHRAKGEKDEIHILNLFGYTGIASLVCAAAGAKVTHVDASYPTIGWARENQEASGLGGKPVRWILDDAVKFVRREEKRGIRYDGIIMDPPVFGHGPTGERWEFYESFPGLLALCRAVVTESPAFILINAYAISASSLMLGNILQDTMKDKQGIVESGELVLKQKTGERSLSTGIYARWSRTSSS